MKKKKHRRKKTNKVNRQMSPKPETMIKNLQELEQENLPEEDISEPEQENMSEEDISEPEQENMSEEDISEPEQENMSEEDISEPEQENLPEEDISEPEQENLLVEEEIPVSSVEDIAMNSAEEADNHVEEKPKGRRWRLIALPLTALIVLAAVYLGFSFYFSEHFFWGTRINGYDCGGMTLQDAEDKLQQSAHEYQLTIYGRNGKTETIMGRDIGMSYQIQNELQAICDNQNAFLWFIGFFQNWDYAVNGALVYDQEILAELVEMLSVMDREDMQEPVSARISDYLPEIKGYQIIEEEEGSMLVAQEASTQIMNAVFYMQDQLDLDGSGLYVQPKTRADNQKLNRLIEELNHYTQTEVIYTFGDEQVVLDGDTIHDWISVRGSFVYLDREAVRSYVEEMARERNTYYNEKDFVTTAGEVRHLRSRYGWLIDINAETEELLADLENGGQSIREPIYDRRAADYSDNGIADSYVEIDLGHQHLYLYVNGVLILETDFVSGSMISGNGTPAGIYDLDYKTRNTVLRGPTWESYVNYWMPFNGDVGMHDATWRNQFGGDIYINGGSHGCVNLPYAAAQEIYQYVYSGFPVICYY